MNLHLEILKALVEMVKTGGGMALWGMGIYLVLSLVKVGLVLWVSYKVISLIINCVSNLITLRFMSYKDKVVLLSQEVSKHLQESIDSFRDNTECAMKCLLQDVKNLVIESKDSQKKK